MKPAVYLSMIILWATIVSAAEVVPGPSKEGQGATPEAPSQPAPPSIDPGIQRRPSTVPDPRSAVPPPNVDPEMAVNPETAPPALEGGNTPAGPEPKKKESR